MKSAALNISSDPEADFLIHIEPKRVTHEIVFADLVEKVKNHHQLSQKLVKRSRDSGFQEPSRDFTRTNQTFDTYQSSLWICSQPSWHHL